MKRSSLILTLILAGIMTTTSAIAKNPNQARNYTNVHVKGCFVGTLAGFVIPTPDPTFQIPTNILVRYCADGKGSATAETTQTVGGVCTVETAGDAQYTVDATGIGTVTANLQITDVIDVNDACAAIDFRLSQGTNAIFELKFGIERKGCHPVIALSLAPDTGLPVPFVAEGRSCRQ